MQLNKETHRQIMRDILIDIFESDIGEHLAFKGGTACYFFHGLDRFSTDINLDIISDISHMDGKISQILQYYGHVKKGKKHILSYGTDQVNIKIDISKNIWKSNTYEIKNFFGVDILTQDSATLFANKLVAMTDRTTLANRDIYDVYFFFRNAFPINDSLIAERTGLTTAKYMTKVLVFLKKLPKNYNILDGLGQVLGDEKHKYFVKHRLIGFLIELIERGV